MCLTKTMFGKLKIKIKNLKDATCRYYKGNLYLRTSKKIKIMHNLLLNAFYDSVNKVVGPTLMWVFTFLLAAELIFVVVKYLGSEEKK